MGVAEDIVVEAVEPAPTAAPNSKSVTDSTNFELPEKAHDGLPKIVVPITSPATYAPDPRRRGETETATSFRDDDDDVGTKSEQPSPSTTPAEIKLERSVCKSPELIGKVFIELDQHQLVPSLASSAPLSGHQPVQLVGSIFLDRGHIAGMIPPQLTFRCRTADPVKSEGI